MGSREAADKVRRVIEARPTLGDLGVLNRLDGQEIPRFAEYRDSWAVGTHIKPEKSEHRRVEDRAVW